jgi:aldose sugar dehydrogenase
MLVAFASPSVYGQSVRDGRLTVAQYVSGLLSPTAMAFIADDDILVLQKNDGRVRRVRNGVLQPDAVLDLAVDNASERGLLGIALHPAFPTNRFVYLYYTQSSTGEDSTGSAFDNRVYRYRWTGSTLVEPVPIANLPVTPGPNHDGGTIAFGPDRKLYIVIGDLNRNGRLQNVATGPAPDDTSVILRLNDDGTVPPDNPFAASGGKLARYEAYGIRNSFGLAFDPLTDALWMTENGPNAYDEINLVLPGFNSGWNRLMGPDARDPQSVHDLVVVPGSHYSEPTFSWASPVGPTAIMFVTSASLGQQYQYDAIVGDVNNGTLYRFRLNGARSGFTFTHPGLADTVADSAAELDEVVFGTGFGSVTDLKMGPDGRLYVLSYGLGRIYTISATVGTTTLAASPASVASGAPLTVAWSGINSPTSTDWIGVFVPGSAATAYLDWIYVSCSKSPGGSSPSGTCTFTLNVPAGSYELRLYSNNGSTLLATSNPVAVTRALSLTASPSSVGPTGPINGGWGAITAPSSTDWIGVFVPGAAATAYREWVYVSCTKTPAGPVASGSCAISLPGLSAGNYELRLFANDGFEALATSNPFAVSGGAQLSSSPSVLASGATATVSWSAIGTPSARDWIGLYAPAAPDRNFLEWIYVSCSKTASAPAASGSCAFALPSLAAGTYELRLLANDGFSRFATGNPFTVTQ